MSAPYSGRPRVSDPADQATIDAAYRPARGMPVAEPLFTRLPAARENERRMRAEHARRARIADGDRLRADVRRRAERELMAVWAAIFVAVAAIGLLMVGRVW